MMLEARCYCWRSAHFLTLSLSHSLVFSLPHSLTVSLSCSCMPHCFTVSLCCSHRLTASLFHSHSLTFQLSCALFHAFMHWPPYVGQSRICLFEKFVRLGGNMEQVSLDVMTERLRSMVLEEDFQYLNFDGLKTELKVTDAQALAMQANCRRRGGIFTRKDPNAPCIKELEQYWVVVKTCGPQLTRVCMSWSIALVLLHFTAQLGLAANWTKTKSTKSSCPLLSMKINWLLSALSCSRG